MRKSQACCASAQAKSRDDAFVRWKERIKLAIAPHERRETRSHQQQDGTSKPFLMLINWIKVAKEWKIASEIIPPVPPAPPFKQSQRDLALGIRLTATAEES
jgi:hypothetical protein